MAVEVNANPWRLDLDWRWHRRAIELGCWMSINPDAHSVAEIDLTHWGVEMARKGGVPKERVLNCLDLRGFGSHLGLRLGAEPMTRWHKLRTTAGALPGMARGTVFEDEFDQPAAR